MQHLDEGTIHSWLDGALSADEAARAEAHVAECLQCAAAVAEARGFIAASSRILTALDNAPRGVIPAAAPVKRINPLVWRVAATVLVVAAGSLVVVQNRGSKSSTAVSENQVTTLSRPAEEAMEGGSDAATAAAADAALPKGRVGTDLSQALGEARSKAPAVASVEKSATSNSGRGITTGKTKASADGISQSPGQAAMRSEFSTAGAAPTPAAPTAPPSRAAGVAAMDMATRTELLKVVGSPRQIGAKVTLYEVTPGDTVTLTESVPVALNSVVVTGAPEARMVPQATGKTMAPTATSRRAEAATRDAQEARQTGEVTTAAAGSAAPPTAQMRAAMTLRTIKWIDPATGNTLTLTGRLPESRLQEIRIRIERERSAAGKKIP